MTKKVLSVFIACAMVFVMIPAVSADPTGDYSGDGWSYSNGTLTVTTDAGTTAWHTGRGDNFQRADVTSVIIGNNVTNIGGSAFSGTSLTSVTIPNSVTSIGGLAFGNCTSLTAINVNTGNTHYTSINGVLFDKDIKTLIKYPIGKTNTTYSIPDGVTSIGINAFLNCTSLMSVTIPNGVTSISASAFQGCTSLTSITIPNSVTSISASAFRVCTSLTAINVNTGNTHYTSINGVLFDKDIKTLIQYPIGKTNITYSIPNSVTSIGRSAFLGCTSLTSVTIPDSVTNIGVEAFMSCRSLTSIIIPNSVTNIGQQAFAWVYSLTSVTIPNSVTIIGSEAFRGCTSLTSVTFKRATPPGIFGNNVFWTSNNLTTIYVPIGAKAAYQAVSQLSGYEIIEVDFGDEPVVCADCKKDPCACIDAPDLCIECKKEICVCCLDCGKDPCECVVLCGLCGEEVCVCVPLTVIGNATATITPGLMISIGGAPFEADPSKLTVKVEKKAPENTEAFFAALLEHLKDK
jgi:hypothetical protein